MGDWPGTKLTNSAQNDYGETIFYAEIPSNATGIVFNENGGQQTTDITFNGQSTGWYLTDQSNGQWNVATWNYVPDGEQGTTVQQGTTASVDTTNAKTVYFTNNKGWSDVKAYAWNAQDAALLGEWPGTAALFLQQQLALYSMATADSQMTNRPLTSLLLTTQVTILILRTAKASGLAAHGL